MADDAQVVELIVEEGARRLDAYLAGKVELSRSRLEQLIRDGQVTVNGEVPKKRYSPAAGDRIRVAVPAPEPSTALPEDIPLDIVYQDRDLVVVNKQAGLVVHPAPGHRSGTLVNALLYHVGDLSGIGGVLRPGIVHRLDRDTSGLMIVAKNDKAHERISRELKRRRVKRRYLAASWGHLNDDAVSVEAPIGRDPGDRKKMGVVEGGRRALTHFRRLERWRAADLVRAELESGRTHQIRVHLLHLGHPVVGDVVYAEAREKGFSGKNRSWAQQLARRTHRQFLHAAELEFVHPRTGEQLQFSSPLPEDLLEVADWARSTS